MTHPYPDTRRTWGNLSGVDFLYHSIKFLKTWQTSQVRFWPLESPFVRTLHLGVWKICLDFRPKLPICKFGSLLSGLVYQAFMRFRLRWMHDNRQCTIRESTVSLLRCRHSPMIDKLQATGLRPQISDYNVVHNQGCRITDRRCLFALCGWSHWNDLSVVLPAMSVKIQVSW